NAISLHTLSATMYPIDPQERVERNVLHQPNPCIGLALPSGGSEIEVRQAGQPREQEEGARGEQAEPWKNPQEVPGMYGRRQDQDRSGEQEAAPQRLDPVFHDPDRGGEEEEAAQTLREVDRINVVVERIERLRMGDAPAGPGES